MPSFRHRGKRVSYDVYGSGDRPLVLAHGLLMNRRMYEKLGPEMAARGNRVICVDLLGHGRSDRPEDFRRYSMTLFAEQIVALLDHLELEEAVIGGTSLGANVALEAVALAPDRVRGMFIEMPVLDNALVAVAMIFTPVIVALRFGRPVMEVVSAITRRIPRTTHLADIGLDWIRQEPGPSLAVLEGLLFGRVAPPKSERLEMKAPALIIGHSGDPLHPFSDSGMLAEELDNATIVNASSILEWRLNPDRLNDELSAWLERVWSKGARSASRKRGKGSAAAKRSSNSGKSKSSAGRAGNSTGRKTAAKRS